MLATEVRMETSVRSALVKSCPTKHGLPLKPFKKHQVIRKRPSTIGKEEASA